MSKNKKEVKVYNFGEKTTEKVKLQQPKKVDGKDVYFEDLKVYQTPKYLQSKIKAIELIECEKYGLSDADFWILMNKGGSTMCYTGLIISHNGCLKINAKSDQDKRFKPECADIYKDESGNIVMKYVSPEQGIYEFGEVSTKNCKNDYPYAMALKRLQDRVILKTSEIAFFGIYSDSESDDFKENPEEREEKPNTGLPPAPINQFSGLAEVADKDMKATQRVANEADFRRIKQELESVESLHSLSMIWESNKKEIAKLVRYANDLYLLLVASKEVMKKTFETMSEMDEASNV